MKQLICNICDYQGEFLSHRNQLNRKCPNCLSLERHRNFFYYIIKNDHIFQDKNILHIAPEKSINQFLRDKSAKYYCIDKNPPKTKLKSCLSKDDIIDLNVFNENSFDIVVCFHVLEHIKNDIKAISEIQRILKNNGFAFISVPLTRNLFTEIWSEEKINKFKEKNEWGLLNRYGGHYRTYGQIDFTNLLNKYFKEISFSNTKKMTSKDFFICKK